MAPLALPAMLAGTGLAAGGQIFGGIQAAREGKAAQSMAEYNAQLAEREAQAVEQKSLLEQRRQVGEASRQQSALTAAFGASGAVGTSGSALDILGEQAAESEMENRLIGWNYATEAQKARLQGQQYLREGQMARRRGRNQMFGSMIGAGGTLLQGFGTAYRKT